MKNKTIICHITTVHNRYDDRIFYKECKSLADAGFEVFLIAPGINDEIVDKVNIISIPKTKSRIKRILLMPCKVLFKGLKTKAKVIHFHDPELLFIAVLFKMFGKKVIYDVHEDIVKQILYKEWINLKLFRIGFSFFIKIFEQFCSLFFNKIIVVTDDIANKFSPSKRLLIRNYPIINIIFNSKKIEFENNEKTIIIYAGGLTKIRGIKEIIDALSYVNSPVELLLLGAFDNDEYEKTCRNSPQWKNVNYVGSVDLINVFPYMKASHITLSLLYPAKNYLTSLPVKAFEYMACEKPIIMSDFTYWKQKFKDVALFCNPLEPKEIADKINYLIDNEQIAIELGQKGKKLIIEKYSWEAESKNLVEMYKKLLKIK